jgi:hypothetical protein
MILTVVRIFPSADDKEAVQGFLGAIVRPVRQHGLESIERARMVSQEEPPPG